MIFIAMAAGLAFAWTASAAGAESWDAFTYWWTRTYNEQGQPVDHYNCPPDNFNYGNPVEYGADRFTFSFVGDRLSLNTTRIQTVGFSSAVAFELLFDPGMPSFVPNPYATFVGTGFGSGYVQWAPNTPHGYTATLDLGAITVRKFPVYSSGWEQFRKLEWHSFAAVCLPEPPGLIAIVCGIGWLAASSHHRRRRSTSRT